MNTFKCSLMHSQLQSYFIIEMFMLEKCFALIVNIPFQ